jgi:hypothetical protein
LDDFFAFLLHFFSQLGLIAHVRQSGVLSFIVGAGEPGLIAWFGHLEWVHGFSIEKRGP